LPGALPLAIVAGVATYLVSLWLVRAVTPSEIQLVKGMVRPAISRSDNDRALAFSSRVMAAIM